MAILAGSDRGEETEILEKKHYATVIKRLFTSPYAKFVVKKGLFYIIVTFFAATLVFIVVESMPGDPVTVMLAHGNSQSTITPQLIAAMEAWFGLDKPLWDRYLIFLWNFITGNFGQSFSSFPVLVSTLILDRLPYTLLLAVPVLIISFWAGNKIGARAAYLKGKWNDASYFSLVFCNQLPSFWFAMVILYLYVIISGGKIPPLNGNSPGVLPSFDWDYIWDTFTHWILPFISLLIIYLGGWATGMRSMVTYEMDADYVQFGRQLGFKEGKLMSYTQRNAILPQFTGLNLVFSAIVGNTMIIEIVFGWPGLGLLLYNAVNNLDYPLVFGCFYFTILIIVIGNFLIDILYGFLDPRIRTGQQ